MKMLERICIVCKIEFKARASEIARGYYKCCSKSCSTTLKNTGRTKEKNPNYKDGASIWQKPIVAKVRAAIKKGILIKKPCEVCNDVKVEAHHCDYNKPLEVTWLCRKHHVEWHKNNEAIRLLNLATLTNN